MPRRRNLRSQTTVESVATRHPPTLFFDEHLARFFFFCSNDDHIEAVRVFLLRCDTEQRRRIINARKLSNGCTPLMQAANEDAGKIALLLLERKADVHIRDHAGRQAIHYACKREQNNGAALDVLRNFGDINSGFADETPLSIAIEHECMQNMQVATSSGFFGNRFFC